ncbi:MAG: CvpA family protein [Clostridia bacterium]|nr:CvpA family protein [Clostridia bacterium]
MFNLIDVILVGVVLIAGFIGYKVGFVKTVISFLSLFIALGLALLFYQPLSVILIENTEIDNWIEEKIMNYDTSGDTVVNEETTIETTEKEEDNSITAILSNLPEMISENLNIESAKNSIKHEIAVKTSEMIMKLLSIIIIYVVVKVTLLIASIVLGGMMKLPVLKQLNEILGMSLGAVIGFLNMYLAFAIITFISSITDISVVIDAIKSSMIANAMFENNLIIRFLFK